MCASYGGETMTSPLKAVATLSWSLDVECPHCKEECDLVEYDSTHDYCIANKVFNNKWDDVAGSEITCPHCKQEFELEKVEY